MGGGEEKPVDPTETVPVGDAPRELPLRQRRVLLVYHRDGVETVPLAPGPGVVVGRDLPSDVIIRDASLSRRHARFQVVGADVMVEDLGSTNGTLVNGRRVSRQALADGDVIRIGHSVLVYRQDGA
jgi:pSer/pThr/pTyr-binding forkhead associated (FHA) protein